MDNFFLLIHQLTISYPRISEINVLVFKIGWVLVLISVSLRNWLIMMVSGWQGGYSRMSNLQLYRWNVVDLQ